MAYLPRLLAKLQISYTVPLVLVGTLFYFISVPVDWPTPIWSSAAVKIITEIIVIISLMGAGLKIGMQYGWRHWKEPMRLIHTTMPLYLIAAYLLARYILQLDGASSLLLAAVCVPTDPVLASELQLNKEEVSEKKNTGMRYILTGEAGINDGVAFPFVFLAILWSKVGSFSEVDITHFISYYFLYKIIGGVLVGSIIGYLYSLSISKGKFGGKSAALSGFIGIALALFSFGLGEVVGVYGFLSAFFTGIFAQYHFHRGDNEENKIEILIFTEELEKFLIVVWTLLFGGFLVSGILSYTGAIGALVALIMILVVRPLNGARSHDRY